MPRTLPLLVLLLPLLGALPAHAADPEQTYQIKFSRPDKVGTVYDCSTKIDFARTVLTRAGDKETKTSEHIVVSLVGTKKTLAVSPNGRTQAFLLTVSSFKIARNDAPETDIAPKDAQFKIAYEGGKIQISSETEISPELNSVLHQLFPSRNLLITFDEFLGAAERKKIGDRWPINAKVFAQSESVRELAPTDIQGHVTLDALDKIGNLDALKTTFTASVSGIRVPDLGPAKDDNLTSTTTLLLPVDTANLASIVTFTTKSHGIFLPPDNTQLTIDTTCTGEEKLLPRP